MRLGSIFTTFVGLGVAGGAVFYAQEQLNMIPQKSESSVEMVSVIASSQDIAFGQVIEPHMLTTIAWPAASVPPGTTTDMAKLIPDTGGQPRRATRAISQGELIMRAKVSDWGEKVTIVQTIGENNRAMSIRVNAQTGVGGFVTPGDEVDIVMTRGGGEELRAVTILQKIRVIGVDQRSDESIDQAAVARTVTVEVSPEQGQKLALAQTAGTLSLSLRSLETGEVEPLEAVRLSDLLLEKSPAPEGAGKPVVRVRRGANDVTEQGIN
ncbi:MAG: Flp pilus assembly protein CpaB [Pseudomonadota bacterium]